MGATTRAAEAGRVFQRRDMRRPDVLVIDCGP
jgi:hypothetical protein